MSNILPLLLSLTILAACATVSDDVVTSLQPGAGVGRTKAATSFQTPTASTDQVAVTKQPGSVKVTFQASAERAVYLKEAFSEIQQILISPDLAQQIDGLAMQTLATTADAECKITKLSEVLGHLQASLPAEFTIKSRPSVLHLRSTAGTTACESTGINTRQIDLWKSASLDRKALLINTIAHEMTHLIPDGTCGKQSAGLYTDEGHAQCEKSGDACDDAFLVSYVWGDLIQCAYLVKNRKSVALDLRSCLLNTVNGRTLDRVSLKMRMDVTNECKNIPSWHSIPR